MLNYLGEVISLGVAMTWTLTALTAEVASKRMGALQLNVTRMVLSVLLLGLTLWFFTGTPYPSFVSTKAWAWLALSGFVGYVLGDYCLFNSYIIIGSRFGQLFMTLAPASAAFSAWILLGEKLSFQYLIGMAVTIFGIAMSVLNRESKDHKLALKLPLKGVLLGIGAGMGQGLGLVLSKLGMNEYALSAAAANQSVVDMIPFASTFIRAVVGGLGFITAMYFGRSFDKLRQGLKDKKAMRATLISTVTGPFIGVSLSLMAVQYTKAGIASTLMALTPIFILWPAHVFLGQKVSSREILGAIISVVGVSIFFM
ncbi:MAG: DMT family transporter [Rikenellaceae bacterium]